MKKETKKVAVKKTVKRVSKKQVATKKPLATASSPQYVTREAFDAQIVDMSNAVDNMFEHQNSKMEKRTAYQGWLVSPSIVKRCFAITGHVLLVNAVVSTLILITLLISG